MVTRSEVDGVVVLPGQELRAWMREQTGDTIDEASAHELLHKLHEFRSRVHVKSKQ